MKMGDKQMNFQDTTFLMKMQTDLKFKSCSSAVKFLLPFDFSSLFSFDFALCVIK